MNNDSEPYFGYHVLLSQPFSDNWNVLDLTWARRFLSKAKELKGHDYATTLKQEVKKQRANKGLNLLGRNNLRARKDECTASASNWYGHPKIIIDKENNPFINTCIKDKKDKAESEYSEESDINDISENENFGCNDDYKEDTHPKIDKKFFREVHKPIPNSSKMWLSTGKIAEDVLFNFCKNIDYEHHAHSYNIDYDDTEVKALFTETEWQELTYDRLGAPSIPVDIAKELSTYKKKILKELRKVSMASYLQDNVKYNIHQHYNNEWIQLSVRNLVNLYENTDCPLMSNQYEDWYTVALFGSCIDFCLRDMQLGTDIKRTNAPSLASANRKIVLDRVIEAAKSFNGVSDRKCFIENFKMPKSLRDMLADMIRDVNYEEERMIMKNNLNILGDIQESNASEENDFLDELIGVNHSSTPSTSIQFFADNGKTPKRQVKEKESAPLKKRRLNN
ncbi:c2h2-type zinc finger transcription factor [Gigaspora margarita]|uniref:C2h2-type zinc finger transcription factor n=1 Tax=Gigaspora margarita TaxID=4874 RepID=A0A8H4EIA1_GIGMA|nr:c2h2-type zinc finger transcription factor [Gigaspora margarita]